MMQIGWGSPSFISYVEELEDRTVWHMHFFCTEETKCSGRLQKNVFRQFVSLQILALV